MELTTKEQFKEILEAIDKKPTIEKVIEYLKELNFEFIECPLMEELTGFQISPSWARNYSYLVRRYNNGDRLDHSKLDFRLMIGIRFIGIRMPKYLVYKDGVLDWVVMKPWGKPSEFNSKKKKVLLKFPPELDIEERKVWRALHDKFKKDKLKDPEKMAWYLKFKPMIQNLDKELDHLD